MKIAHVIGAMDYGGVETMALHLIQGLAGPDFAHVVVSTGLHRGERYRDFAKWAEIRSVPLAKYRRHAFLPACARTLSDVRPDAVIAYSFGNHAYVCLAAALAHVPLPYVRVAGSPLRDGSTKWKSMVLAHIARPVCRGEVAVSAAVARDLVDGLHLPARRVTMISNGCDVDHIKFISERARSRHPKGSVPTIAMVSRMDDSKDHHTLLQALQFLREDGFRLHLLLVGDGPCRRAHEMAARQLGVTGNVTFFGNRPDVFDLLGTTDLLVHATHTEGMPNVLIEAMAARIPIVATDIAPCFEVLDGGMCGVLVPRRDHIGLAHAIRNVLTTPALRDGLVEMAEMRVRQVYNIRLTLARYSQLFLEGSVQ